MPVLVDGGPDLPSQVMQAHESGRLVFFCGAGISMEAGLPSFGQLVEQIYEKLNLRKSELEKTAFGKWEYDRVFSLLERRSDSFEIRSAIPQIFEEEFNRKLVQHKHLLSLSQTIDGGHRLVTTNFDDLFHLAGAKPHLIDSAPKLSIPKPLGWQTLVHVHGRLADESDPKFQNLVLSSRDFGAAYLVDRWASRFVTELFRNFFVLFIGYRVKDPPMRYMMDALGAARARNEHYHKAYALVPHDGHNAREVTEEWLSKDVEPILYRSRKYKETTTHKALFRTLKTWSELFKGGLTSRSYFAMRYAALRPETMDDTATKRVVWALSEATGKVAEDFSKLDPNPPIEWLEIFDKANLLRLPLSYGAESVVQEQAESTEDIALPGDGARIVDLGLNTQRAQSLHQISKNLCVWLCNHLEEPVLVSWVLKHGGVLHPDFRQIVQNRLRQEPPVTQPYRSFWDIVSSDYFSTQLARRHSSMMLFEQPKGGADERFDDLRVIDALTPVPVLRDRFRFADFGFEEDDEDAVDDGRSGKKELRDLVELEIELVAGDLAYVFLEELSANNERLARLGLPLTDIVRQIVEWQRVFGRATDDEDTSYIDFPSISDHPQNQKFREWTKLVEALRDSFLLLLENNVPESRKLLSAWKSQRAPLFQRLVLFAETEIGTSELPNMVDRVTRKRPWALWSPGVERELLRSLRKRGADLPRSSMEKLCRSILKGPPRSRFRDMSNKEWARIRDREVWLRLSKLRLSGATLPKNAAVKLRKLNSRYPWKPAPDNSDEFPFWMGTAEWGTPSTYSSDELAKLTIESRFAQASDSTDRHEGMLGAWEALFKEQPFLALHDLFYGASQGKWPSGLWKAALYSQRELEKTEDDNSFRVWKLVSALLSRMPQGSLIEVAHAAADWLRHSPSELPQSLACRYWSIWDKLWSASETLHADKRHQAGEERAISDAINHPAGVLAELLLNALWQDKPSAGDGFPANLRPRFDVIASSRNYGGYLGRVILASRLPNLFLLDREWATENLIKRMAWKVSDEVPGLWQGFMWSPRLVPGLLDVIKGEFLKAVRNSDDVGAESGRNMRRLFTFVCLENPDTYKREDVSKLLSGLAPDQLVDVAHALKNTLESARDRREELWRSKVSGFLKNYWPRSNASKSPSLTNALIPVAIEAGEKYAEAIKVIRPLIGKVDQHPRFLLELDRNGERCVRSHPGTTLELLYRTLPRKQGTRYYRLSAILDRIEEANPKLKTDQRMNRLRRYT